MMSRARQVPTPSVVRGRVARDEEQEGWRSSDSGRGGRRDRIDIAERRRCQSGRRPDADDDPHDTDNHHDTDHHHDTDDAHDTDDHHIDVDHIDLDGAVRRHRR